MKLSKYTLGLAAAFLSSAAAAEDPSPQHVQWMKESGDLQGKIRKNVDVEASGKRMAALHQEVGKFWAARSETGKKTTADIVQGGLALAKAAAAGNAEGVAAANKIIGGGCRGCHDAHREKISDTVYKIR